MLNIYSDEDNFYKGLSEGIDDRMAKAELRTDQLQLTHPVRQRSFNFDASNGFSLVRIVLCVSQGCYRNTFDPAYNEFGYNEHPAIASRFLCIKIIDHSVKKFGYKKQPLITSNLFCIFLLVVSRSQCTKSSRNLEAMAQPSSKLLLHHYRFLVG